MKKKYLINIMDYVLIAVRKSIFKYLFNKLDIRANVFIVILKKILLFRIDILIAEKNVKAKVFRNGQKIYIN